MTIRSQLALLQADDRSLAGRAADGDTNAFAVLVHRHGPIMRAYARRLLGRSDEVDDVVQEAFIDAWNQLEHLNDPGSVRSWMMRIVSNKSIDRIRARRDHDDIDDHEIESPTPSAPESVAIDRSRHDALTRVLVGLPDGQRRCWLLKELGGYSYDEIANALGLPVSTVRGLLARSRKTVTSEMEAWR